MKVTYTLNAKETMASVECFEDLTGKKVNIKDDFNMNAVTDGIVTNEMHMNVLHPDKFVEMTVDINSEFIVEAIKLVSKYKTGVLAFCSAMKALSEAASSVLEGFRNDSVALLKKYKVKDEEEAAED